MAEATHIAPGRPSAIHTWKPKLAYLAIVVLAIGTGAAMRWLSVTLVGMGSDDYPQHCMLDGAYPVERSPFDLYNCWSGDTMAETEALMDFGTIPWWTHPELRLAMMRPLSSALIAFDHDALGKNVVAFHLHSMLWWAFLVACAALLLVEILPRQVAAVAVLLFAVEEGHGLPVLWLANRNALVSLSLALLGLWSHIRWRRSGRRSYLLLSAGMFSLALLGGEWTMPIFAYLFAFELLGAKGSPGVRFCALLPAAILGLLFLIAQHLLNYSALNSDVYINPTTDPLKYLVRASQRFPVFFGDLILGIPAFWYQAGTPLRHFFLQTVLDLNLISPEVWRKLPEWQFWHVVLGTGAGVLGFFVIRWGLREQPPRLLRQLRWLLLGALFSLLPMVGSFPSSRLVLPASVGVTAVWAAILLFHFRRLRLGWSGLALRSRLTGVLLLAGLLLTQVLMASLNSMLEVRGYAYIFGSVRQWILQSDIDASKSRQQHVFLVNSIEHTNVLFAPYVLHFHGRPMPLSIRILSAAPHAHEILRTDDRTLKFTVLGGTLLESDLETLYRAERFPLDAGDRVILDEFSVQILRVHQGKPVTVRFVFDRPLEDPSYLFLYSTLDGLRRFPLPAVGQTLRVPKAVFPDLAYLQPRAAPGFAPPAAPAESRTAEPAAADAAIAETKAADATVAEPKAADAAIAEPATGEPASAPRAGRAADAAVAEPAL